LRLVLSVLLPKKPDLECCEWGLKIEHAFTGKSA